MKLRLFKWDPFQTIALDFVTAKKAFGGFDVFADAFPLPPSMLLLNESLNLVSHAWWNLLLSFAAREKMLLETSVLQPTVSFSFMPLLSPFFIPSLWAFIALWWLELDYTNVAICFQLKYFLESLRWFICIHYLLRHYKLPCGREA